MIMATAWRLEAFILGGWGISYLISMFIAGFAASPAASLLAELKLPPLVFHSASENKV